MFLPPVPLKIFPVDEQNVNHTASYLGLSRKLVMEAIVTKTEGQCQLTYEKWKPTSFREPRKKVKKLHGDSESFVILSDGTVKSLMSE